MRRNRVVEQDRCYHLVSWLAHRAFFLDGRIHFSRYYMMPLVERGLVARTDPENPMSPRQEYKLA